jgi:DNA-binding CsgD family transcriptional regulator/large-conductance mechanosensitive channel
MKEKLTNKITDFGIVFIAITALPFNIVTYFALENSVYFIVRFITPFLGLSIVLLALFRKKISLKIKVSYLLSILLFAGFFCLLLGLLDTASLWFVLAIIYTLFTGKRRNAFILFALSFLSVLATGALIVTKNPYIPFDYGFQDCQYACITIRILDFLIIGFLIYYIVITFLNTINSYIDELSEKSTVLEKLNIALKREVKMQNKNAELKNTLELKNKQLAINTLRLLKKTEFENSILPHLKSIADNSSEKNKKKIKQLVQSIKINSNSLFWDEFEKSFIEVNTSFYTYLNENYPDLSKTEKKLAAFIKLNMNTKDIAAILNISTRGVETARYRLRKKLKLEKEKNIYKFIQQF